MLAIESNSQVRKLNDKCVLINVRCYHINDNKNISLITRIGNSSTTVVTTLMKIVTAPITMVTATTTKHHSHLISSHDIQTRQTTWEFQSFHGILA